MWNHQWGMQWDVEEFHIISTMYQFDPLLIKWNPLSKIHNKVHPLIVNWHSFVQPLAYFRSGDPRGRSRFPHNFQSLYDYLTHYESEISLSFLIIMYVSFTSRDSTELRSLSYQWHFTSFEHASNTLLNNVFQCSSDYNIRIKDQKKSRAIYVTTLLCPFNFMLWRALSCEEKYFKN